MKTRVVERPTRVREIMQRRVVTIGANTSVADASRVLLEHHITGAPVVQPDGSLAGVVSLSDIVGAIPTLRTEPLMIQARPHFYRDVWEEEFAHVEIPNDATLKVHEVMTPVAFTVDVDDPISDAVEMMLEGKVHRLIVTSSHGIAGILSTMDIIRLVPGILGED